MKQQRQEIKERTIAELKTLLVDAREELFKLTMQKVQQKLKNVRSIFNKRKEIARMQTYLSEKNRAIIKKETI